MTHSPSKAVEQIAMTTPTLSEIKKRVEELDTQTKEFCEHDTGYIPIAKEVLQIIPSLLRLAEQLQTELETVEIRYAAYQRHSTTTLNEMSAELEKERSNVRDLKVQATQRAETIASLKSQVEKCQDDLNVANGIACLAPLSATPPEKGEKNE